MVQATGAMRFWARRKKPPRLHLPVSEAKCCHDGGGNRLEPILTESERGYSKDILTQRHGLSEYIYAMQDLPCFRNLRKWVRAFIRTSVLRQGEQMSRS